MYQHSMMREITWAIGKQPENSRRARFKTQNQPSDHSSSTGPQEHAMLKQVRVSCFVVLFILFILTSPMFYAVHAVLCQLDMQRHKGWDSKNLQLPLMYALLSEERDMVELFLDYGCSIKDQDADGNNVYHHLATMSAADSQKAIRCHTILISVCNDESAAYVITEQQNRMCYTAWEYTAKYGSLHLCCLLASDRCGFGKLVLGVSRDYIWADVPERLIAGNVDDVDCTADSKVGDFNIWEFDISRYETGTPCGRQSYPLQLITSRSVEKLPESDVSAVLASKFITTWISTKMTKYMLAAVVSQLIGVVITLFFLMHIVRNGGDMNTTPLYDATWTRETYLGQFDEIAEHNKIIPTFNATIAKYDIGENTAESCMFVLHQLDNGNMLIDDCQFKLVKEWQSKCNTQCKKAPSDDCPLSLEDIIKNLFSTNTPNNKADWQMQMILHVLIGLCLVYDLICRLVFLFNNFNWNGTTCIDSFNPVLTRRIPGSYLEKQLNMFMYSLYISGSLLGSVLHHAVQTKVAKHNAKFLSVSWRRSHNSSNATGDSMRQHIEELIHLEEHDELLDAVISKVIIICLLMRFIQAIYSLRLIPGIGFFVITAKKMAHHLMQFAVIFVIVLLAFGTIFYFIMRQPECPAMKVEGFQTLMSSLFSTYQVSLGYGELDFSQHLNAKVAYVAFTVMAIMLLLNLIIAVMTTTVDDMNQLPWKDALKSFELWNEILGVEEAMLILTYPFRLLEKGRPCGEKLKKKTTFEVAQWAHGTYFS